MALQIWHILENTARLQLDRLAGMVDPANPAGGIGQLSLDGAPLAGMSLLGVELPATATPIAKSHLDYYQRGGDLVATYAETQARPLRAQVYWRAIEGIERAIAAVELIASVQTSLLDSCPELTTHSAIAAGEAFRLVDPRSGEFAPIDPVTEGTDSGEKRASHCILFRLAAGGLSYVEMVHADEIEQSSCQIQVADAKYHLRHRLFAERLEKGVILRARLRGVWLDREGDQAAAAWHHAAFGAAPLPLTT